MSSKLSYFSNLLCLLAILSFSIYPLSDLLFDSLASILILLIVQACLNCLVLLKGRLFVSLTILVVMFYSFQYLYVPLRNFLMFFVGCSFALPALLLVGVFHLYFFLTFLLIAAYNLILVLLPYCLYMQSDLLLFFYISEISYCLANYFFSFLFY